MSRVPIILLLSWSAIEIGLVLAADECSSNSHCRLTSFSTKVCCAGFFTARKTCRFGNCIGRYCSTDGDCGGVGECCKFNVCTRFGCSECFSNFACASSEYCCRYTNNHNVCRRSCVAETCHSDFDCGGPNEYCDFNNKCAKSVSNTDLGSQSKASSATLAGWVIGLIVTVSILSALVIGGVCLYRRCYKKSRPGVVRARPAGNTNVALQVIDSTDKGSPSPIPQPHPQQTTQSTITSSPHIQTSAAPSHPYLIHTTSDTTNPSAPPLTLLAPTPPFIVSTQTPSRILPTQRARPKPFSGLFSSALDQGLEIAQPDVSGIDVSGIDASSFLDSNIMDSASGFTDLCCM